MSKQEFEALARERKARRLCDVIQAAGGTAAIARTMPESDWQMAQTLADTLPASRETRALTIWMLAEREQLARRWSPEARELAEIASCATLAGFVD